MMLDRAINEFTKQITLCVDETARQIVKYIDTDRINGHIERLEEFISSDKIKRAILIQENDENEHPDNYSLITDDMTWNQRRQVTEVTRIYREPVWSDKYQPKIRQPFFFYIIGKDKNGYDKGLSQAPHNMGRGELIIKYTAEDNSDQTVEYSNFLEALSSPGADTTIKLFEEGNYEVYLDYAITDTSGIKDSTSYYRTSFSFKIRNGNCMVYIFDSKSGGELSNGDVTENGFRIDSAKSSYPKLTVKKEILNNTGTGLIEDTRYNQAVTDGEVFTEEGIYTVTAHNRFDSYIEPAVKKIYVGSNKLLTAYI